MKLVTLLLVGDKQVGKRSFASHLLFGDLSRRKGLSFSNYLLYKNEIINLRLILTSKVEKNNLPLQGAILLFSVQELETLTHLSSSLSLLEESKTPYVLLGNKADIGYFPSLLHVKYRPISIWLDYNISSSFEELLFKLPPSRLDELNILILGSGKVGKKTLGELFSVIFSVVSQGVSFQVKLNPFYYVKDNYQGLFLLFNMTEMKSLLYIIPLLNNIKKQKNLFVLGTHYDKEGKIKERDVRKLVGTKPYSRVSLLLNYGVNEVLLSFLRGYYNDPQLQLLD